jgi:hypothetical protein
MHLAHKQLGMAKKHVTQSRDRFHLAATNHREAQNDVRKAQGLLKWLDITVQVHDGEKDEKQSKIRKSPGGTQDPQTTSAIS